MSSNYPTGLDSFPVNHQDDVGEVIHAFTVNDLSDAVNKIEAELGVSPSGTLPTVASLLAQIISDENVATAVNANAADTYIGSPFAIAGRIQANSFFRWNLLITKTNAGVAQPIFNLRVGTAGTTSDSARVAFTTGSQTAAVDTAWVAIDCVVKTYSASGVLSAGLRMDHQLSNTGLGSQSVQVFQVDSSTFDLTAANLKLGLSINPGASGNWTIVTSTMTAHNLSG